MLAVAAAALALAAPLPDLDQAAPLAVSVVARGEHRLLVFGSAVDNRLRGEAAVASPFLQLDMIMSL